MKRAQVLLGTFVEVTAEGISEDRLRLAMDAAFQSVAKVQRLMSAHDHRSQLSRLNRYGFQGLIRVHPWLYEVLRIAVQLYIDSKGSFDCTIAPVLKRSGHLMSKAISKKAHGDSSDIQLLSACRVRFSQRLNIDLGGIAKGFAVDKAIEALKKHGVPSASVNAGGDIRVYGKGAYPVFLRRPDEPSQLLEVGALENGAIASSATYFSSRKLGLVTSALINPHAKLKPSLVSVRSFSVIAPTCTLADGLTKALIFAGQASSGTLRKYKAHRVIL